MCDVNGRNPLNDMTPNQFIRPNVVGNDVVLPLVYDDVEVRRGDR